MPYADPDKRREYHNAWQKRWKEKNPERWAARRAKYKPKMAARAAAWYAAKKAENPEHFLEKSRRNEERRRGKRKINLAERRLARQRRRVLLLNVAVNDFTWAEWLVLVDEFAGACAYCGATGKKLEIDHVVPLSKGGNHTYENIVPACKSCNSAKRDRSVEEFYAIRRAA